VRTAGLVIFDFAALLLGEMSAALKHSTADFAARTFAVTVYNFAVTLSAAPEQDRCCCCCCCWPTSLPVYIGIPNQLARALHGSCSTAALRCFTLVYLQ